MTMPPATLSYEEEEQRFYAALGKAITQWVFVEAAVGFIFSNPIGLTERTAKNLAFYTIIDFKTKLDLTDSAIDGSTAAAPLRDEWKSLYNKATKRNKRRNYLAHYMAGFDQAKRAGYRWHLRPSAFNDRIAQQWGKNPPRLTTCQIIAFGNAFDKLAAELRGFSRRLAGEQIGRILEPLVRASHPQPQLRAPSAPNDKAPEAPPSPSKE